MTVSLARTETATPTYLESEIEPERGMMSGVDFYKPTMSQLAFEQAPDAQVTFTFHNRGSQHLLDYVDPLSLQARFDSMQQQGFQQAEIDYLASRTNKSGAPLFKKPYLDYLATAQLPAVSVGAGEDIEITSTGAWPLVTFWETVVMSEVNEAYFAGYAKAHDIDIVDLYAEGDRRLSEKIAYLQTHPDVMVAEFGTRRRFSFEWQAHVIRRLKAECPENLLGVSNVGLATAENLRPMGTFAHELDMVYAGLADALGQDIRASHGRMLDDWYELYGNDYSLALSDTFGSDFFLEDFGATRAKLWLGSRHDSGDPLVYGDKVIDSYVKHSIDPRSKSVAFTDGLNIKKTERIRQYFTGRLGFFFGIGTDLTNDLGLAALSIVMKATEVNGTSTVKLSDDPEKYTGPEAQVTRYKQIFAVAAQGG